MSIRLGILGLTGAAAIADATALYSRRGSDAGRFQDEIMFPQDLKISAGVPYISMRFVQYQRRSIYNQPVFSDVMKISLPIPENLVERTDVAYSNESLGSAVGAVTESLSGVTRLSSVQEAGDRIFGATAGIGARVLGAIANTFVGNTNSQAAQEFQRGLTAASVLTGVTTNPFQVVLFKSPDFRRHTFQWKLVPRNKQESDTIERLVNTFKYHALPGLSPGAVFFSYPEILEIKFRPADQYLYKFKPCVVKNITVNYAPNSPSFYKSSNAPTAVQFAVELQEIELITKADYLRDSQGRYGAGTEIAEFLRSAAANPAETNAAQAFSGGGAGGFGL
jgi:hypothetical protein